MDQSFISIRKIIFSTVTLEMISYIWQKIKKINLPLNRSFSYLMGE